MPSRLRDRTNATLWWRGVEAGIARTRNVEVLAIDADASRSLTAMAGRAMDLQATLQEGLVYFSDGASTVEVHPRVLRPDPSTAGH